MHGDEDGFSWRQTQVAVIGLGLMGGSWAGAVRPLVGRVIGYDVARAAADEARRRGLVDEIVDELGPWLGECRLVVMAVPPLAMGETARRCVCHMHPGSMLTDLASVKEMVVEEVGAVLQASPGVCYVPGHPLTGREKSGTQAAEPGLFRGAPYVLCEPQPAGAPGERARTALAGLLTAMGARVRFLSAREHDFLVAATSHLPYVVAVALCRLAASLREGHVGALELAASGFRDTTRVALSPPELWAEILASNRRLPEAGRLLGREIEALLGAAYTAATGDGERLSGLLGEGRAVRDGLEKKVT